MRRGDVQRLQPRRMRSGSLRVSLAVHFPAAFNDIMRTTQQLLITRLHRHSLILVRLHSYPNSSRTTVLARGRRRGTSGKPHLFKLNRWAGTTCIRRGLAPATWSESHVLGEDTGLGASLNSGGKWFMVGFIDRPCGAGSQDDNTITRGKCECEDNLRDDMRAHEPPCTNAASSYPPSSSTTSSSPPNDFFHHDYLDMRGFRFVEPARPSM
ncbi:hypothetical protein B0H34DRAFT_730331 [Crassisporium funariophilum]|nr:hypothetical protein B0H34DRAFT_730331 [Crassisporium funariophilum]